MSREKVIELARADLGYTEDPAGSNRTKYGEAYGTNGAAWCVQALWFWFREAGERMAFFGGGKTASCSTLLRWYKEQGLTVPVEDVQVGDIVLLNFHGGKDPEHCGLVRYTWSTYKGSNMTLDKIQTIEGNTTPGEEGSQDNGGCVAAKTRYPAQIVAVCRPQYQPEPVTVDDITGHWAEKEIRRCIERGMLKGYPDGSFAPDKPITRAEAAVMMDRLIQLIIGNDDGK